MGQRSNVVVAISLLLCLFNEKAAIGPGKPSEVAVQIRAVVGRPVALGIRDSLEKPIEVSWVPEIEGSGLRAVVKALQGPSLKFEQDSPFVGFRMRAFPDPYPVGDVPNETLKKQWSGPESVNLETLKVDDGKIINATPDKGITFKIHEIAKLLPDVKFHWFLMDQWVSISFDTMTIDDFLKTVVEATAGKVVTDDQGHVLEIAPDYPKVKDMWAEKTLVQEGHGGPPAKMKARFLAEEILSLDNKTMDKLLEKPRNVVSIPAPYNSSLGKSIRAYLQSWYHENDGKKPGTFDEQDQKIRESWFKMIDPNKSPVIWAVVGSQFNIAIPTTSPNTWIGP